VEDEDEDDDLPEPEDADDDEDEEELEELLACSCSLSDLCKTYVGIAFFNPTFSTKLESTICGIINA